MAFFTYTGTVNLPVAKVFNVSERVPGFFFIEGITTPFPFNATTSIQSPVTTISAVLTATIPTISGQTFPSSIASASASFWLSPTYTPGTTISVVGLTLNPLQASGAGSSITKTVASTTISGNDQSTKSPLASPSSVVRPTPSSSTDTPQPEQERYGVGHLVGTAVGCLIGGALLATAALLLFMRRRSRNRNGLSEPVREMSALNGHGKTVYVAGSKAWECHLPQSESDGTIRNMADRTLDQIEMHVENFYKDAANVHLSSEVQSKITELDSRHLQGPLLSLLSQSSRPTVLIKHCIANLVISRIDAGEVTSHSFLPKGFSSLGHSSTAQRKPGRMNDFEK
jgi:hypothetical protein